MNRGRWLEVSVYGLLITAAVLGAMAVAVHFLGMDEKGAVTVSFLTLAFAQLWHVFNMREKNSGFFSNSVVRNPFVWGALGLCSLLLLAAVAVPLLAQVLDVVNPGPEGWLLILGMSLLPLAVGQIALGVMKDRTDG